MYGMGHSMGGPVVIKLAAENPHLFKTIVVAAGAIDPGLEKKETWRQIVKHRPLFWLMPGAFAPSNTELLYLKKDLVWLKDDFKKVTCNVVFVHGDKDSWVPVENIEYGKRMLVNARSVSVNIVKGAGHQIPWKQSKQFKQILLSLNEK
jgi:pimeloyl-ACP methyl ester carboxylesterase